MSEHRARSSNHSHMSVSHFRVKFGSVSHFTVPQEALLLLSIWPFHYSVILNTTLLDTQLTLNRLIAAFQMCVCLFILLCLKMTGTIQLGVGCFFVGFFFLSH